MMYVYQDCCAGGVDEQSSSEEASLAALRLLVCGDYGDNAAAAAKAEPRPAGTAGPRAQPPPADGERGRLQRLRDALAAASRHLAASGESLGEAVPLAAGQLEAESPVLRSSP